MKFFGMMYTASPFPDNFETHGGLVLNL